MFAVNKNNMKKIITAVLLMSLSVTFSCNKINNFAGDNDNGTLSATVDGKSITPAKVSAGLSSSTLSFNGSNFDNDEELSITIYEYDKAINKYSFNLIYNQASYTGNDNNSHLATSGELYIESTGEKSAKGTFYFDAENGIKVTDGKFDIHWD